MDEYSKRLVTSYGKAGRRVLFAMLVSDFLVGSDYIISRKQNLVTAHGTVIFKAASIAVSTTKTLARFLVSAPRLGPSLQRGSLTHFSVNKPDSLVVFYDTDRKGISKELPTRLAASSSYQAFQSIYKNSLFVNYNGSWPFVGHLGIIERSRIALLSTIDLILTLAAMLWVYKREGDSCVQVLHTRKGPLDVAFDSKSASITVQNILKMHLMKNTCRSQFRSGELLACYLQLEGNSVETAYILGALMYCSEVKPQSRTLFEGDLFTTIHSLDNRYLRLMNSFMGISPRIMDLINRQWMYDYDGVLHHADHYKLPLEIGNHVELRRYIRHVGAVSNAICAEGNANRERYLPIVMSAKPYEPDPGIITYIHHHKNRFKNILLYVHPHGCKVSKQIHVKFMRRLESLAGLSVSVKETFLDDLRLRWYGLDTIIVDSETGAVEDIVLGKPAAVQNLVIYRSAGGCLENQYFTPEEYGFTCIETTPSYKVLRRIGDLGLDL